MKLARTIRACTLQACRDNYEDNRTVTTDPIVLTVSRIADEYGFTDPIERQMIRNELNRLYHEGEVFKLGRKPKGIQSWMKGLPQGGGSGRDGDVPLYRVGREIAFIDFPATRELHGWIIFGA